MIRISHKLIIFALVLISVSGFASDKYRVSFKDKAGVIFDPLTYFDVHALERRICTGLPLCDSLDFPVSQQYIESTKQLCDSLGYESRWLNSVAVFTDEKRAEQISRLPFVAEITPMSGNASLAVFDNTDQAPSPEQLKKILAYQTDRLGGDVFRKANLDGKGVRIAILDAGFPGVDILPAFAKLRSEKRIVATYDFLRKKDDVFHGHWHGTATLSCVTAVFDGQPVGLATGAEILLARTERAIRDSRFEEDSWIAAAEWADKNGADIISSSLGYTSDFYFNTQMDGRTSHVSIAATIAAKKGILVVNAAGNDGSNDWETVGVPADADSVMSVGGTDPYTDYHIYFSSYGPTSDGRLKPNVCAPARCAVIKGNGIEEVFGTSFSAPLVAGFAACAWQQHRHMTNMELFYKIEESGSLYPYFDYAHGFGIPQASYFFREAGEEIEPTFDFVVINNELKATLREKYTHFGEEQMLGYEVQRNLFYKVEDREGKIKKYMIMLANQREMLHADLADYFPGDVITIHFEGYTNSFTIPEKTNEEIK